MKFCDRLNLYIETLGCSAKTLSAASGISDAAISRYRSGEREPGRDSEQLLRLAQGICAIAAESDDSPGFSEGEVLCALRASLHTEKSDFDSAVQNLKNLLTAFGISYAELSRAMNFDASYLSRVCSGQRKPANTEEFITQVCRYVTRRCLKTTKKKPSARSSVHPQSNLQSPSNTLRSSLSGCAPQSSAMLSPSPNFSRISIPSTSMNISKPFILGRLRCRRSRSDSLPRAITTA